jgi:hypothetical protein
LADWAAIGELRGLFAVPSPRIVQSSDAKPNFLIPIAARPFADLAVIRTIKLLSIGEAPVLRAFYRCLHKLVA